MAAPSDIVLHLPAPRSCCISTADNLEGEDDGSAAVCEGTATPTLGVGMGDNESECTRLTRGHLPTSSSPGAECGHYTYFHHGIFAGSREPVQETGVDEWLVIELAVAQDSPEHRADPRDGTVTAGLITVTVFTAATNEKESLAIRGDADCITRVLVPHRHGQLRSIQLTSSSSASRNEADDDAPLCQQWTVEPSFSKHALVFESPVQIMNSSGDVQVAVDSHPVADVDFTLDRDDVGVTIWKARGDEACNPQPTVAQSAVEEETRPTSLLQLVFRVDKFIGALLSLVACSADRYLKRPVVGLLASFSKDMAKLMEVSDNRELPVNLIPDRLGCLPAVFLNILEYSHTQYNQRANARQCQDDEYRSY